MKQEIMNNKISTNKNVTKMLQKMLNICESGEKYCFKVIMDNGFFISLKRKNAHIKFFLFFLRIY